MILLSPKTLNNVLTWSFPRLVLSSHRFTDVPLSFLMYGFPKSNPNSPNRSMSRASFAPKGAGRLAMNLATGLLALVVLKSSISHTIDKI